MDSPRQAIILVILLLLSGVQLQNPNEDSGNVSQGIFDGFSSSQDIWNETPFRDIAAPDGFNLSTAMDYSDVAVLINNQSEVSRTIGWAFVTARNISADRVFIFDNDSTPTGETINRNQFNTYFLDPFRTMLSEYNGTDINYLVTTKGVPLRVNGGNDKAAFDQEISLAGGSYDSQIGADYWINHGYGPLAGKKMEKFTRDDYGFFLVTRLTGYTVDTALELIEKANNSFGARGTHVLDLATNRNDTGYKFWNDDLYVANSTLNGTMNLPVIFDEETEFVTNLTNVIGYASWGSNDGNWNYNYLPNGGFDTLDASWSSGSRYWDSSAPAVSAGDVFNWSYQTDRKQGGNGAFEAEISSQCVQESGHMLQGIFAEYFDNEGISFSSASMPDLIDRVPDHVRIESDLAYSSSGSPYPGLDDRFKHNWGARFSGLIDVPEDGNWTFYLNTDDGSELWINGVSAIQNYGMHGMREYSATLNLTAGYHDFRIEFFQGGGPHGLRFSWDGPNVSKATIPASAFYVSGDVVPQSNNLIHVWDFEEGSGSQSNDGASNDSNFTLYGMNSSNWKTCIDGDCLWFDGDDDYAKVDVDDWLGNFSVSQWVWANKTNQTSYASTFAIDDNAGSNQSFQHMVMNGEWKLHNNQSKTFGDVEAQKWTHLVTVFDAGTTRQYMDGVLVNTNFYPNGSVNNFDLYKLGVNRAGSSYFEGMIDNVMIWDTALENSSVTALNRNIINNCSAYSGNGQDVAYLETTYDIPTNFTNHAWVVYAHGSRTGDVFGEYQLQVTSFDSNGTELTYNESSNQDFTASWNSRSMRFRPHADATSMQIRISLDIVPTSTDGSLFVDSTVLRVIRPHMDWVNGSIVETAVSTGARSFNWDTSYGQSLIADILEDGASGIKGYVYEPYLTAVSSPSTLLTSYASGYNMAESYAAANLQTGWMGVVVGDPKMSAYGDIVHDVEIIDARILQNVSLEQNVTLQVAIQNIGPGAGSGLLMVQDKVGGRLLANYSIQIPAADQSGSRKIIEMQINSTRAGWNNLVVKWEADTLSMPEREKDNNQLEMLVWVNSAPIIEAIYCDSTHYSRGDRFICTVNTIDDIEVTSLDIGWRASGHNLEENQTVEWNWVPTGSQDGYAWWTTIELPTNIPLGQLDISAIAYDASNQTTYNESLAIANITDAPAFWYGIHVQGVDNPDWGGVTVLDSRPIGGILRGHVLTLKACVIDPDHNPELQSPMFIVDRGQVDGLTYQGGDTNNQHCYISSYTIPVATSLQPVTLELRGNGGALLTTRTIGISDQAPRIQMALVDDQNAQIQNILGGGNENLLISIEDPDDNEDGAFGDLTVHWPGQPAYTWPIQFENGLATVPISTSEAIDSGDLFFEIEVTGANGAKNSSQLTVPILLTPPEILSIDICQDGEAIDQLMFGQAADAVVRVKSSRPLDAVTSEIVQFGWIVSAPSQDPVSCGSDSPEQTDSFHFRIQLDSSFIAGNGSLRARAVDIDEISSSSVLDFEFLHSPPTITVTHPENVSFGGILEFIVEMQDPDGIDATCGANIIHEGQSRTNITQTSVRDMDGTGVWSGSWLLLNDMTSNLTLIVDCIDISGNEVNYSTNISIDQSTECVDCNPQPKDEVDDSSSDSTLIVIVIVILLLVVLAVSVMFARAREEEETEKWALEEEEATRDERIPEGWTLEEFVDWLNGPRPDDWEEEQWEVYRQSLEDLM